MRNLIIDIGNTRIKTGLFWGNKLQEERWFGLLSEVTQYVESLEKDQVLVSSVKDDMDTLQAEWSFDFLYFDHTLPLPINNNYGTPETLGLDRLAAVIGALDWAEGPVLTIDLGTCITYDLLDEKQSYLGGAISPGLLMRARAMHEFTVKLPMVSVDPMVREVGDTTVTCLQSGIYHGVKAEILGFVDQYAQNHAGLKVFICGGDANFFESLTKDHIFVIPNLVLHGLNRILTYNVEKN
ncbi:type III pantothenate kinase [Litoribacter ruber]|uniref:type III pantothenate kinase n=1 Tax=Litoribacter ruber TaxID=702568 RepID=UPI001BDB508B|nr:type III pantothenate kinase [Litoribacter ruber]MBT0812050.1 type III pantothenate kinase [Litoribacter ruber]